MIRQILLLVFVSLCVAEQLNYGNEIFINTAENSYYTYCAPSPRYREPFFESPESGLIRIIECSYTRNPMHDVKYTLVRPKGGQDEHRDGEIKTSLFGTGRSGGEVFITEFVHQLNDNRIWALGMDYRQYDDRITDFSNVEHNHPPENANLIIKCLHEDCTWKLSEEGDMEFIKVNIHTDFGDCLKLSHRYVKESTALLATGGDHCDILVLERYAKRRN